jgi:hypothetical protein
MCRSPPHITSPPAPKKPPTPTAKAAAAQQSAQQLAVGMQQPQASALNPQAKPLPTTQHSTAQKQLPTNPPPPNSQLPLTPKSPLTPQQMRFQRQNGGYLQKNTAVAKRLWEGTTHYAQMVLGWFVCLVYIAPKRVCNPQKIALLFTSPQLKLLGWWFTTPTHQLACFGAGARLETCHKYCGFVVARTVTRCTLSCCNPHACWLLREYVFWKSLCRWFDSAPGHQLSPHGY